MILMQPDWKRLHCGGISAAWETLQRVLRKNGFEVNIAIGKRFISQQGSRLQTKCRVLHLQVIEAIKTNDEDDAEAYGSDFF